VVQAPREAIPILATTGFSPADRERVGPHKYILGEVYSGQNCITVDDKVRQLETLLVYMMRRWNDRFPEHPAEDVTQLVGCGIILLCAGTKPRMMVLDSRAKQIAATVTGTGRGGGGGEEEEVGEAEEGIGAAPFCAA